MTYGGYTVQPHFICINLLIKYTIITFIPLLLDCKLTVGLLYLKAVISLVF